MEKIILISEYTEGKPVVASVRYCDLMRHISGDFEVAVVSSRFQNERDSVYASENFKYSMTTSRYTTDYREEAVKKKGFFEKILRESRFIHSMWKNYSKSSIVFNAKNRGMYGKLMRFAGKNEIMAVVLTVPGIEGAYIAGRIKDRFGEIPLIVEIRDILDNYIEKSRPALAISKAERIISKKADGIIALSKGIFEHYEPMKRTDADIEVITNGYSESDFGEFSEKEERNRAGRLVFAHVGSIYSGRNVGDFIRALYIFSEKSGREIEFNMVGFLDSNALSEVEQAVDADCKNVSINVLGTMEHKRAVEHLRECDFSVVLTHRKGSGYAIPGKVFEYIGSCRPIIAVTKDRELVELVDGVYGECAGHEAEEIAQKLEVISGKRYDFSDRDRFSRKRQAQEITSFIRRVSRRCEGR